MNPKDRSGLAKPNLSIVPLIPLYEAALALFEGARKYGPWNWRKEKIDEVVYVDAAIRHLNQWLSGEDIDPDSELPHISKAIAGLILLRDAQAHDCSIDTRREKQSVDYKALAAKMAEIVEKYPEPVEPVEPVDSVTECPGGVIRKWSATTAGVAGGVYEISKHDVGKTVMLRNGGTAVIYDVNNHMVYPVIIKPEGEGRYSTTTSGYKFCAYRNSSDVVRVYHQGTP